MVGTNIYLFIYTYTIILQHTHLNTIFRSHKFTRREQNFQIINFIIEKNEKKKKWKKIPPNSSYHRREQNTVIENSISASRHTGESADKDSRTYTDVPVLTAFGRPRRWWPRVRSAARASSSTAVLGGRAVAVARVVGRARTPARRPRTHAYTLAGGQPSNRGRLCDSPRRSRRTRRTLARAIKSYHFCEITITTLSAHGISSYGCPDGARIAFIYVRANGT